MADDYSEIHALMCALTDAHTAGSIWTCDGELQEACLVVWKKRITKAQREGRVLGLNPNQLPWSSREETGD